MIRQPGRSPIGSSRSNSSMQASRRSPSRSADRRLGVTERRSCERRPHARYDASDRSLEGLGDQLPISPPSSLVITMHAERWRAPSSPSGHELYALGFAGSLRTSDEEGRSGVSPGCWMPTNNVFSSGVAKTPVISHCRGPRGTGEFPRSWDRHTASGCDRSQRSLPRRSWTSRRRSGSRVDRSARRKSRQVIRTCLHRWSSHGRVEVAAEGKHIPGERRLTEIVPVTPGDDVAVDVDGARIDRIDCGACRPGDRRPVGVVVDRGIRRSAAVVVGECGDRRQGLRESVNPLRTVHHRGSNRVGGAASVDQDVVLRPRHQSRVAQRRVIHSPVRLP